MAVCLIQVSSGAEKRVCDFLGTVASGCVVRRAFVPRCEVRKHWRKEWRTSVQAMFPGCVFVETDDVAGLEQVLGGMSISWRLFGGSDANNECESAASDAGDAAVVPLFLTEDELEWVESLAGEGTGYVAAFSRGVIDQGETKVLEGALVGHEADIRKIDRHKRLAYLHTTLLGLHTQVRLGLEITSKTLKGESKDEGPAEGPAQGATEGLVQGATEGTAQGATEGLVQGATEGTAQGPAEGPAQGPAVE